MSNFCGLQARGYDFELLWIKFLFAMFLQTEFLILKFYTNLEFGASRILVCISKPSFHKARDQN